MVDRVRGRRRCRLAGGGWMVVGGVGVGRGVVGGVGVGRGVVGGMGVGRGVVGICRGVVGLGFGHTRS